MTEQNEVVEGAVENVQTAEETTCDICDLYKGNAQQMATHKYHCAKKAEEKSTVEREREPEKRRERVPFGTPEQKLKQRNGEDGYMYYTFNDNWMKEPGRIKRAESAGYERTDTPPVTVGTNEDGSPIKGVEMRIPKELYDEDQANKQKEVDRVDEAIRGGTFEEKEGDRRYTPDGIKMWSD
ncbi:MAG: hypothetical protein GY861_02845 [bacterium]|nr:hypothetical protein [bacterium]